MSESTPSGQPAQDDGPRFVDTRPRCKVCGRVELRLPSAWLDERKDLCTDCALEQVRDWKDELDVEQWADVAGRMLAALFELVFQQRVEALRRARGDEHA